MFVMDCLSVCLSACLYVFSKPDISVNLLQIHANDVST